MCLKQESIYELILAFTSAQQWHYRTKDTLTEGGEWKGSVEVASPALIWGKKYHGKTSGSYQSSVWDANYRNAMRYRWTPKQIKKSTKFCHHGGEWTWRKW